MNENISMLEKGDKIEIFGDYFKVGETHKKKGKLVIDLMTEDPDIIESYIEYFSPERSVLNIARNVKFQMKRKNVLYNGSVYQIIKEHYETSVKKSEEGISRKRVYEIRKNKEPMNRKISRKIIFDEKGKAIFYNDMVIYNDDIILNPEEDLMDSFDKGSKKIHFKFKEKI